MTILKLRDPETKKILVEIDETRGEERITEEFKKKGKKLEDKEGKSEGTTG